MGIFASVALAGSDDFTCTNSSNAYWCVSPYQHHSMMVEAWYTGTGDLPLAAGSYANSWIFYTDTSIYGTYNYVEACYAIGCTTNSSILGTFYWQNQHSSLHTVYGRDTY